jgi:hypothetical protein
MPLLKHARPGALIMPLGALLCPPRARVRAPPLSVCVPLQACAPPLCMRPPPVHVLKAAMHAPMAAVCTPETTVCAPDAAMNAHQASIFAPINYVRPSPCNVIEACIHPSNVATMWQPPWTRFTVYPDEGQHCVDSYQTDLSLIRWTIRRKGYDRRMDTQTTLAPCHIPSYAAIT